MKKSLFTYFLLMVLFAAVSFAWPDRLYAGCTKDTDCKGDRICENGRCVSPDSAPSRSASSSVNMKEGNQLFDGSKYYIITARHNGKVLDVGLEDRHDPSLPNSDRDNVLVYPAHGGANQKWKIEQLSDGYYKITAVHNGKALDVGLDDRYNPAQPRSIRDNVLVYKWHGGDNQRWKIELMEDGAFRLTAKHNGKALDVGLDDRYNPSQPNSARDNVLVFNWHGGQNQRWSIEEAR